MEKIQVPDAPSMLPAKQKKEWVARYEEAFLEAKEDGSKGDGDCRQFALREANRMLRVPVLKSVDDVKKLEPFHVHHQVEKNGKLIIVTIDGKKYSFDAPEKKAATPAIPAPPKP
jgi:hypothetical protein